MYSSKYKVSHALYLLLQALGIVVTDDILAIATGYVGSALYKGTVGEAPTGVSLAIEGQVFVRSMAASFKPSGASAKLALAARKANVVVQNALKTANVAVLAARKALSEGGLDPALVPDAVVAKVIGDHAAQATDVWATSLFNEFTAHCKRATEEEGLSSGVLMYALDHMRGFVPDLKLGTIDASTLRVPIPGTKGSGSGTRRSNGPKRSLPKPTRMVVGIAVIDFAGCKTWKSLAQELVASKVLDADSNTYRSPSLERFARAYGSATFQFENGTELSGDAIVADLDALNKKA